MLEEQVASKGRSLEVAGTKFSYAAQKFIIQAMCFFGHKAATITPCFGLWADGITKKSVEQVQAAYEHFQNGHGLLCDPSLWERDDSRFEWNVEYNIMGASEKQKELQLKARQLA